MSEGKVTEREKKQQKRNKSWLRLTDGSRNRPTFLQRAQADEFMMKESRVE